METSGKTRALPEGLYYKLLIAGAIALTCVLILVIRYFIKPQDASSVPAKGQNNVFDRNPGPLAGVMPPAKAPEGEQGSSLEMLKNANKGTFVERTSAPDEKTAPAAKPPAPH
jgi:hypothetical protein